MNLQLKGAPNFRDLGGYPGAGGRRVRRGRLFRSDHLGALTAADIQALTGLLGPAPRVCDFRGAIEREAAPCAIPGATVHSLAIEPTIVQKLTSLLAAGQPPSGAQTVALMQDTYRGFVRGNTPRFAALFEHLLAPHDAPVVFHCTAGKDRTGFAAALVLQALGVERAVVLQDFLLTNERLQGAGAGREGIPKEIIEVLYSVQQPFLDAAFEAVEADFGSVEAYLRQGLRLGEAERRRLHALYLESPHG